MERDLLIPALKNELLDALARRQYPEKLGLFLQFGDILKNIYHYHYHNELEKIKDQYESFNPAFQNQKNSYLTDQEEYRSCINLIEAFKKLLKRADYIQIENDTLTDILREDAPPNIQVDIDPDQHRDFIIFVQGEKEATIKKREWYWLWLHHKVIKSPYYQRVAILMREIRVVSDPLWKMPFRWMLYCLGLKEKEFDMIRQVKLSSDISLKIFKDLNKDRLFLLFPYAQMRMKFCDKVLITVLFLAGIFITLIKNTLVNITGNFVFFCILTVLFIYIVRIFLEYKNTKELLIKEWTEHIYYNNIRSNTGVLESIVNISEEEAFKETILPLAFLWTQSYDSLGPVTIESLRNSVRYFFEEELGVKVNVDIHCFLDRFEKQEFLIPLKLIQEPTTLNIKLKEKLIPESRIISVDKTDVANNNMPLGGTLILDPNSELEERKSFVRNPYRLHLDKKVGLYHPAKSPLRFIPEKPYQSKLFKGCYKGDQWIEVAPEDAGRLPLSGLGRLGEELGVQEFRYRRLPGSNRLKLVGSLRFSHICDQENTVLVRPIPPRFTLDEGLPQGIEAIPIPNPNPFPPLGTLSISLPESPEVSYHTFVEQEWFWKISPPIKKTCLAGTLVTLCPPTSFLEKSLSKGSCLVHIRDAEGFKGKGIAIISPRQSNEERGCYHREVLELIIETPMIYSHSRESTVLILTDEGEIKAKLLFSNTKKCRKIMVRCILPFPQKGEGVIDPGENKEERFRFHSFSKLLYLEKPADYFHESGSLVQAGNMESPLRHSALQGEGVIVVEDANYFPLFGVLEIHFNGDRAIKEVLPFVKGPNSHSLLLIAEIRESFPAGTSVTITSVEKTLLEPIHHGDSSLKSDFSCIPNFPAKGNLIVEPGTSQEESFPYTHTPDVIYLASPLKYEHPEGTKLSLSSIPVTQLAEKASMNNSWLILKDSSLFPEKGVIQIGEEELKYTKKTNRVLLSKQPAFHHSKGSRFYVSKLEGVYLTERAEAGSREIKIEIGGDLPPCGYILMGKYPRSTDEVYHFTRIENTLYLDEPLSNRYKRGTFISLPELQLADHLSPEDRFLEIATPTPLPSKGTFCIYPKDASILIKLLKNIINIFTGVEERTNKKEFIPFRFSPGILWLEKNLREDYPSETSVSLKSSPFENFGSVSAVPMEEAFSRLKEMWESCSFEQ